MTPDCHQHCVSPLTGPSMAPDHRKQIDNLKKFSVDFRVSVSLCLRNIRSWCLLQDSLSLLTFPPNILPLQLQPSSGSDPPFDQMMTKPPRDQADKSKDLPLDKSSAEDGVVVIGGGPGIGATLPSAAAAGASKPGSPAALSPSPAAEQKRAALDVTSQGVQTTATFSGAKHEEKEEKKEAVQE